MSNTIQTIIQVGLLGVSLVAAFVLSQRNSANDAADVLATNVPVAENKVASYDMLQFLNDQIAQQECKKDVRCWSSVSKFQMFAAGAPIEHEALGARIEQYHILLDDIWSMAASKIGKGGTISKEILLDVLSPMIDLEETELGDRQVKFKKDEPAFFALNDLVDDYSDTIESWRILQSWASQKTDADGGFDLSPVFSKDAMISFQKFLVSFDLALLKRAKEIATDRKMSVVDAKSMEMAFELDFRQGK